MKRRSFLFGAPLALAACGPAEPVWAPEAEVRAAAYRYPGPPMLTLFTMKNVSSDNGAHTGLMINASQRVIFDPAGTFGHDSIPERNDVHFGITPWVERFYETYHSRSTYYLVRQDLVVPAATAEMALREVMNYGAVPKALCTTATSRILSRLPGFERIHTSFFPDSLERQFATFPGVVRSELHEDDSPDKSIARANFDPEGPAKSRGGAATTSN